MIVVQPFTVGPIIGSTTGTGVCIFGRGAFASPKEATQRCIGVIRIRGVNSPDYRRAAFFELDPNFDMTGVVTYSDLRPEADYAYQAGYVTIRDDQTALNPELALDWSQVGVSGFRTAAKASNRTRSFIFGSCRYLARLWGRVVFARRGDRTFRSMLNQIEQGRPIDLLLMLGDQIYADAVPFLDTITTLTTYNQRYRDAFSQPSIRELMSRIPTYMTLDDHEIEDGWPRYASMNDWLNKYPAARHALITYQLSHSPLFDPQFKSIATRTPEQLWYTLCDGCCEFFMTDTRSERFLSNVEGQREIMSAWQMQALKAWLNDGSGRVKFIVSGPPIFPDELNSDGDAWDGFLKQRTELLDFIRSKGIRRVVFLCGDLHAATSAELVHPDDADFKTISLISSPFYWPYPHSRAGQLRLSGQLQSLPANQGYTLHNVGPVYSVDNFMRVTVDLDGLTAEVFGRSGELLGVREYGF